MKMRHVIITLLIAALIFIMTLNETKTQAQSTPQYEYLVMNYGGGVKFEICRLMKQNVIEESKACAIVTHRDACESIGAEKQLDILGADGWQLVSVLGTIGGEQIYYFKRVK